MACSLHEEAFWAAWEAARARVAPDILALWPALDPGGDETWGTFVLELPHRIFARDAESGGVMIWSFDAAGRLREFSFLDECRTYDANGRETDPDLDE